MEVTPKRKSNFYQILGSISLALLIISLSVHLMTFWNINLQDRFPYVFLLHIGFFVLIISVALLEKLEEIQADKKIISIQNSLIESRADAVNTDEKSKIPKWLIAAYFVVGFYAMLNFLIFGLGAEGNPSIKGDKYVLENHGHIIREISKDEYDIASAQVLRGFSGHWIIFYFYITTVAFLQVKELKE